MAQLVKKKKKNLPAIQETWVQSLDWEYPLEIQYSCLENPRDRGAGAGWREGAIVRGIAKSWTQLND